MMIRKLLKTLSITFVGLMVAPGASAQNTPNAKATSLLNDIELSAYDKLPRWVCGKIITDSKGESEYYLVAGKSTYRINGSQGAAPFALREEVYHSAFLSQYCAADQAPLVLSKSSVCCTRAP